MDTVIIYDRVLTSDQVLQKYKGYYRVDVERSEDQQDGRMIYGPYHFARHVNATRPLELLSKVYSMKLMDL